MPNQFLLFEPRDKDKHRIKKRLTEVIDFWLKEQLFKIDKLYISFDIFYFLM